MNGRMTRTIALAALVAALVTALVTALNAEAVEVTFQVRVAYQVELGNLDAENNFVDLAGTFNGWRSSSRTLRVVTVSMRQPWGIGPAFVTVLS